MNWRFINTAFNTGSYNMAVDESILYHVGCKKSSPTVRFYGWSPACISLGYFQNIDKSLDVSKCKSMGFGIVRRITGGRTILHDKELTYSLCIPENYPHMPQSVSESYRLLSGGLLEGYKSLGIKADLAPLQKQKASFATSACFDSPSSYELTVCGKKVAGSAQTRKHGALLQHGSIPNIIEPEKLFACLLYKNESDKLKAINDFSNKAGSICEFRGSPADWDELINAFYKGFEKGLGINLKDSSLSKEECDYAIELEKKYSSDEWTYKR